MPMGRELGVGFFSDPGYHVEHTLAEFDDEMRESPWSSGARCGARFGPHASQGKNER